MSLAMVAQIAGPALIGAIYGHYRDQERLKGAKKDLHTESEIAKWPRSGMGARRVKEPGKHEKMMQYAMSGVQMGQQQALWDQLSQDPAKRTEVPTDTGRDPRDVAIYRQMLQQNSLQPNSQLAPGPGRPVNYTPSPTPYYAPNVS